MKQPSLSLMEILVVAAVLLVLLILMLPKFKDSQIRTKISKSLYQMDQLRMALNRYRFDQNRLPTSFLQAGIDGTTYCRLTTPTAFLPSIELCKDPLASTGALPKDAYFHFYDLTVIPSVEEYNIVQWAGHRFTAPSHYVLQSFGPSQDKTYGISRVIFSDKVMTFKNDGLYSATNGLLSKGSLFAIDSRVFPEQ